MRVFCVLFLCASIVLCTFADTVVLNNATLTRMFNKEYTKYAPIAFLLPKSSELQALALRNKYFGTKHLERNSESAEKLGMLFGDSLIGFSGHRLANLICRNSNASVYYYLFDYIGNNSFYRGATADIKKGVAHHDDLIYLFSMPGLFPDIGLTGADAQIVNKMTAMIYIFAKFGNPNAHDGFPELSQLSWPRMIPTNRSYLRISTEFTINQNLYEDRFSLWDRLFPIIYTPKLQTPTITNNSTTASLISINTGISVGISNQSNNSLLNNILGLVTGILG